jgi:hypothetical protein
VVADTRVRLSSIDLKDNPEFQELNNELAEARKLWKEKEETVKKLSDAITDMVLAGNMNTQALAEVSVQCRLQTLTSIT